MEEWSLKQPTLIGRDAELSKLREALDSAISGKGSTVFISGETGIGKTRLTESFKDTIIEKDVSLLTGSADSGSARPFLVLSKALGGLIERPLFEEQVLKRFVKIFAVNRAGLLIAQASSGEEELDADIFAGMLSAVQDFVRDSFDQGKGVGANLGRLEYGDMKILMEHGEHLFLTTVFSGNEHANMKGAMKRTLRDIEEKHHAALERWTGKMSELAPIQEEISKLAAVGFLVRRDLGGVKLESERIRIADEVLEALVRSSAERPMAVFLEDLHWADESSLFVINYLARNIRKSRVLLVGTLRPGEPKALQMTIDDMKNEDILHEMHLEKLGPEGTKALIDRTMASNNFPDTLAQKLHQQSDGNPLFIIEMLRNMHDEGSISRIDGKYTLVSETYSVPATVEDVVNRRLESLDPESMAMVEYASCIGQRFGQSVAISNLMVKDPGAALEKLQASGILQKRDSDLEFSHAVFQSVIYNGIGERWRAGHHKSIGEHLEIAFAQNLDAVMYDLARHFSRTREHDKCSGYCIRAGEKAESSFAVEQALKFYGDALAALSKRDAVRASHSMLDVLERVGDIRKIKGDFEEANDYYLRVKETSDNKETKARMLRKAGAVHYDKGDYESALALLTEAKGIVETGSAEHGRIINVEGNTYHRKGDFEKAMQLILDAIEIAESVGTERKDIGEALRTIGNIHMSKGDYQKSLQYSEKSLAVMEEIGHQYGIAAAMNNIGIVRRAMRDYGKALDAFSASRKIAEKLGLKQGAMMTLGNIGMLHASMGEFDNALDAFKGGLRIAETIGDRWGNANALLNIGNVRVDMGELDKAIDSFLCSLEAFEKIGDKSSITYSLTGIGNSYALKGDLKKAQEFYGRSLAQREEIGDRRGVAMTLNYIGETYLQMGEPESSLASYERSLDVCKEIGEKWLMISNLCGIAEAHAGIGSHSKAIENAENALAIASEMGEKAEEARCRRVLGIAYLAYQEFDRAADEFRKAAEILEGTSDKKELARLLYERGLFLKTRGDSFKAKEHLEKALTEFQRMQMMLWAEKCRKAIDGM